MDDYPDLWEQLNEACHDMSGAVGGGVGGMYGAGAYSISGSPAFAGAVGGVIEDTVSDGWGDVCDLPETTGLLSALGYEDGGAACYADGGDAGGGDYSDGGSE